MATCSKETFKPSAPLGNISQDLVALDVSWHVPLVQAPLSAVPATLATTFTAIVATLVVLVAALAQPLPEYALSARLDIIPPPPLQQAVLLANQNATPVPVIVRAQVVLPAINWLMAIASMIPLPALLKYRWTQDH